jgi:hypothetical protein
MISVPVDLQKRMLKHAEVNWSGIAAEAFERKLNDLSKQKEVSGMSGMIERLRASKERATSGIFTAGREAGEKWAKDAAEFDELQRLEQFRDRLGSDWDAWFVAQDSDAFGGAHWLAVAILDGESPSRQEVDEFWDRAISDTEAAEEQRHSSEFVRGFAEGALEAFKQVKDHL